MKKILIFAKAVVFSAVFMFLSGCDRQPAADVSFDNDGFNLALNDVYSNFGSLTRSSGPEDTDAYIEDVEMLMNWLQDIADEYGVKEIVENSAYYKDLDMSDISELAEMDAAERTDFINRNATPEFTKIYTQLAENFTLSGTDGIEFLTNNTDLLPNEKLALTAGFTLFGNRQEGIFTRSNDCTKAYSDALDDCYEEGLIGLVVSFGSAFGGVIPGIATLIGTGALYIDCVNDAKKALEACLEKAKDIGY